MTKYPLSLECEIRDKLYTLHYNTTTVYEDLYHNEPVGADFDSFKEIYDGSEEVKNATFLLPKEVLDLNLTREEVKELMEYIEQEIDIENIFFENEY